jgi:hypothetical protein
MNFEEEEATSYMDVSPLTSTFRSGLALLPGTIIKSPQPDEDKQDYVEILYEPVDYNIPDINTLINKTDSLYRLSYARIDGVPRQDAFYTILCNPLLVKPVPRMVKIYSDISSLGLSSLFKLDNDELITIHEVIFGGSTILDMNPLLFSEMIKHGIIRFLHVETNTLINYNSGIIKSSVGIHIRNKVATPSKRVFITKSQHDKIMSVPIKEDFISTHAEVNLTAKSIGMLIPPHATDAYRYYMDNYQEYSNVDNISGEIDTSSDEMIFKSLGIYFLYTSRVDLVMKAKRFLRDNTLIVFIPYDERYFTVGINKVKGDMPTSLEGPQEIMEANSGISFGNYYSTYTLSVDELLYQFRQNPSDLNFRTVTMDPELRFSIGDIYMTIGLLILTGSDILEDLAEHVQERIKKGVKSGIDLKDMKRSYKELEPKSKEQVNTWFDDLFLAGMYFRRWNGKGLYPMSSNSTRVLSANYAEKMGINQLAKMNHDMEGYTDEAVKYIKSFRTFDVSYTNKSLFESPYYDTIYDFLIKKVLSGEFCIRIGSNLLIATAAVFKEEILESRFKGFSVSIMDLIA